MLIEMNWLTALKSRRTWKAAHAILKETKILVYATASGPEYRQVNMRTKREARRKFTAYQLATADGFRKHPDHYWHEARKAMIMADKLVSDPWRNR